MTVVNGLTGEYNDLTEAVRNYARAQQAQAAVEAETKRLEDLYSLKSEIEEKKASSENKFSRETPFQTGFSGIDDLIWGEHNKNHDAEIDEFNRQIESVENQIKETTSRIEEYTRDYYETATESADGLIDSARNYSNAVSDEKIAVDSLATSNDKLLKDYQELYELLGKVQSGEALTYEEIQKLIGVYPALLEHISLTSDGYVIEKNAVDGLNAALDDSVETQINAEREKTLAAIEGAKDRIKIYQKERESLEMYMASKGGGTAEEREKAKALSAAISDESSYLDWLYEQMKGMKVNDALDVGKYLKNGAKPSSTASGGTSSQKGTTKKTETEPTEAEKNAEEYAKKKKDLDYQLSMDEIDKDTYYKKLGEYRDTYLEKDSDAWRSANVDIHKHEKSQKEAAEKSTKGASKGTVISIDSYIPTLWDDEEESNRKLQEALGIELAGNSQTGKRFSVESPDSFAEATSLSPSTSAVTASQSAPEATLSDVLKELRELKETDVKRKIALDVDLYARDLLIGRVSIEDTNDIAKQTGKNPFSFM